MLLVYPYVSWKWCNDEASEVRGGTILSFLQIGLCNLIPPLQFFITNFQRGLKFQSTKGVLSPQVLQNDLVWMKPKFGESKGNFEETGRCSSKCRWVQRKMDTFPNKEMSLLTSEQSCFSYWSMGSWEEGWMGSGRKQDFTIDFLLDSHMSLLVLQIFREVSYKSIGSYSGKYPLGERVQWNYNGISRGLCRWYVSMSVS